MGLTPWNLLLGSLICVAFLASTAFGTYYNIGVGRGDATGPSAEIVFMGYAKSNQKGCGIHTRQYARAFIIDDNTTRILYVSLDAGMVPITLKNKVLVQLKKLYDDTYTQENFILSGTHTHNGPGGFMSDVLFDISIFGACEETIDAYVDGIVDAVKMAHESVQPGYIYISGDTILDANINRSPASYLQNPEEERAQYDYDTDKTFVQMKFDSVEWHPLGVITWYAVHPVSLNNTNCLVSSDNVGYASMLLEEKLNPGALPGQGKIVAAFASTNLGDVSPNTLGPRCIDTGEPCDTVTSTCNGRNEMCIASGPGRNMYESNEIIATKIFNKAYEVMKNETSPEILGPIRYIHQFVDMRKETVEVQAENGTIITGKGCYPAMGYSFAAGTTDGPGEFDFTQGSTSDNPFWNLVRDFIFPPTAEDIECHYPKPILMGTGRMSIPYEWQPHIVATQMFTIGNFSLVAVPGEFTTMSGRRLRKAVKEALVENGAPDDTTVVIAGLSNSYTNYIATFEEYQLQRYEGASTVFGPYTLDIYLQQYKKLAKNLMQNKTIDAGPTPADVSDQVLSLITPVVYDSAISGHNFGDCIHQPESTYKAGEVVKAIFVSGHPRNNRMKDKTFLTVEKVESNGTNTVIATDASLNTRFIWKRVNPLTGTSKAEVRWQVKNDTESGTYIIRHFGYKKTLLRGAAAYSGSTDKFLVEN